jgi:hypothetical protein
MFDLILIEPHNFPKIQQVGAKFKDGFEKGGAGFQAQAGGGALLCP